MKQCIRASRMTLAALAVLTTTVLAAPALASRPAAALPATTAVSGHVAYTASNGTVHPARFVRVEIRDATGATPDGALVKAVATNQTGDYTASVATLRADGSQRELFVRAVAQSGGFAVSAPGAAAPQHIDSAEQVATGAPLDVDLTANNVDDSNTAFDVADALVTGVAYSKRINMGQMFGTVPVTFPAASTGYAPATNSIQIAKLDRFDWDVILHEYGHYVGRAMGMGFPGGEHSGDNLAETYGKLKGIRMAWGEGFATWFSVLSQRVQRASALHIPRAGDTRFDDTENQSIHVDLATSAGADSLGEDNEDSVARFLWHVVNDPALGVDDRDLFRWLRTTSPLTLSDAVTNIVPVDGGDGFNQPEDNDPTGEARTNAYACALTAQNVAPKVRAPDDGSSIAADAPPVFAWQANGAGPSFRLNEFRVEIWSPSWDKLLFTSPTQTTTSFAPTQAQWDAILAARDQAGHLPPKLNVTVVGRNLKSPITGPYRSCGASMTIEPTVKGTPVDGPLMPMAPMCEGAFPADRDQFTLTGMRLQPNTTYALKLHGANTGYPDTPLPGTFTSDADGRLAGQLMTLPLIPAHQSWEMIATPTSGSGPTATGALATIANTCLIYAEDGDGVVYVDWGGAGMKPGSVVKESWNGGPPFTATADATGTYAGSYALPCPAPTNTVTATVALLDHPSVSVTLNVTCVPASPGVRGSRAQARATRVATLR